MAQTKFAETLKELRIYRDLTQKELSSLVNISRQTLSNYENGERIPDLDTLNILADFFGVTLDQLVRTGLHPVPGDPFASLPEESREIMQKYHRLPLEKQKSLREYLDFLGQ